MAASSSKTYLTAGTIKPIAYARKKRLAEYPNVPTFGGTPDSLIEQINRDVHAVLHDPQFNAAQVAGGGYDAAGLGPREFARHIVAEEMVGRAELVRVSGA